MGAGKECARGAGPKLIFACSGAADVGAVADQAARKLTREGAGKMYCLAGIGGRVPGIVKTTASAAGVLVIDGCAQECAKNCLVHSGFQNFEHLRLADLGMEKGKTPATTENIEAVASKARAMLLA